MKLRTAIPCVILAALMAACSNGGGNGGSPGSPKSFRICPGPKAQSEALIALFDVREGETVEFCAGTFDFTTGLILHSKKGVTIKGAGKDKTILRFKESGASEGINVSHSDGITLQGFTVEDTPGNAVRVFRTQFVTIRDVRTRWRDAQGRDETQDGYTPRSTHGAYGLYPVEARHVLMENCEAHGASDAGVYVGQSSDIVVRHCLARYNVAGYEFENTYRAVFEDNIATDNVGGFLVFDLPNLAQYGEKNIVRRNKSFGNNTDNFAPIGNIVGVVPRGTGMLVLATDQLEIYDNEIYDNDTLGLAVVNFALAEPNQGDIKYDFFPEAIAIYDNVFRDNGGNPQEPDPDRGEASFLPALLKARNAGRGVHIMWDGAEDAPNGCTAFPKDSDGVPLDTPNDAEDRRTGRYEARVDERGRPNYQRTDRLPECTGSVAERKYNAWKFQDGKLVFDKTGLYIPDTGQPRDNVFESTRPETAGTSKFLRANITSSDPNRLSRDLLLKQPEFDLSKYQTPLSFIGGGYLRPLRLPYTPTGGADPRPSRTEIDKACNAVQPGRINWAALARYNCPRLDQYGLFELPEDPRTGPNGGGVPFELTSTLFSDYAVKYRFLFLPPLNPDIPDGSLQPAAYRDKALGGVTATLDFPVGTVLAKTFAFRREYDSGRQPLTTPEEDVVETRLLIKRQTSSGGVNWVGLPYLWTTDANGRRIAELKLEGGTHAATYRYDDPDPAVPDANGAAPDYEGSVEAYAIPAALNCITCHGGDDRESGAAPLGLKPRLLNRNHPALGMNQLDYLRSRGLMTVPENYNPGAVEKHPRWNVPGDSGQPAGSAQDVHQRVRAYLEVNCMHCHNPKGGGSNSGLFLDSFRTVNVQYGICKKPVAAGKGSGGRLYDIVPGAAAESILAFRIHSAEAGVRMPPLARSVPHGQAADLIDTWIDAKLPELAGEIENEEVCSGPAGGAPAP